MLTLEPEAEVGIEETFTLYEYCFNDPVNSSDPSGLAPQADTSVPQPPAGVPEFFTYRYSEQEIAEHPIVAGETYAFGPYQYTAISKTDRESVASAVFSNAGRGLHDIPGAPYVLLKGLFTWSKPEFYGPRDRIDYVDVTYKLSFRHYTNVGDKNGIEAMDLAWFQDHKDATVQQLSQQLNQQLKYFYLEQFGIPVAAEVVGGVFRLRTVVGEVNSSLGGVGPGKITVYRVEGAANTRIAIGENGAVAVVGDDKNVLYLNFGNRARAEEFFAKRLRQNFEGTQMKAFEVPKGFVDDLRLSAVDQNDARLYPDRPFIADPTKAPDQYGLRPEQIEALRLEIIQGTGRVIK